MFSINFDRAFKLVVYSETKCNLFFSKNLITKKKHLMQDSGCNDIIPKI